MAEAKQENVVTLALNQTELLVTYDGVKSLLRSVWSGHENVPLEVVFCATDLLKTLTGPVNEVIARQQSAQQQNGAVAGTAELGPAPSDSVSPDETVH